MSSKSRQASLFKGLFFAMLSGASFSVVAVTVKMMRNLHPIQLALYRFIASFFISLPETIKTGQNPLGPPEYRLYLVLSGIFGGIGKFVNFMAFQYLGLGEASVIILSSPVFVTVFARVFFKEPCNILQSLAVMLTVLGIIFTTKIPARLSKMEVEYSNEQIYGLLAAIFSVICVSGMHLVVRKAKSVSNSIANFNYSWVGMVVVAVLAALIGNFKWHHCGIQSLYILILAAISYSGLSLLILALQCENAGPVSTVRAAADISLAFVWQIFIFHDVPDSYGIIGAVLILISIILIGLDKWIASSDHNLPSCKKFKFF